MRLTPVWFRNISPQINSRRQEPFFSQAACNNNSADSFQRFGCKTQEEFEEDLIAKYSDYENSENPDHHLYLKALDWASGLTVSHKIMLLEERGEGLTDCAIAAIMKVKDNPPEKTPAGTYRGAKKLPSPKPKPSTGRATGQTRHQSTSLESIEVQAPESAALDCITVKSKASEDNAADSTEQLSLPTPVSPTVISSSHNKLQDTITVNIPAGSSSNPNTLQQTYSNYQDFNASNPQQRALPKGELDALSKKVRIANAVFEGKNGVVFTIGTREQHNYLHRNRILAFRWKVTTNDLVKKF